VRTTRTRKALRHGVLTRTEAYGEPTRHAPDRQKWRWRSRRRLYSSSVASNSSPEPLFFAELTQGLQWGSTETEEPNSHLKQETGV